jgi:prophage DNA circulation protein
MPDLSDIGGAIQSVGGVVRSVGGVVQSVGSLAQTLGTSRVVDNSGASWLGSTWWAQLQPGSWRGVGFVMDAAELKAGRRTATHEYPYRDTVWTEDLGKLPRRFAFQAWLVGDDVYQQRDDMLAACEKTGSGTLVHPTMGAVEVVLVDFTTTDRRERGRVVELAFQFVAAGKTLFPTAVVSTGEGVETAAKDVTTAAGDDLKKGLDQFSIIPPSIVQTVDQFGKLAIGTVNDAARAINAVRGIAGVFGRFGLGNRSGFLPAIATVNSVLSASITTRNAVVSAAGRLTDFARAL